MLLSLRHFTCQPLKPPIFMGFLIITAHVLLASSRSPAHILRSRQIFTFTGLCPLLTSPHHPPFIHRQSFEDQNSLTVLVFLCHICLRCAWFSPSRLRWGSARFKQRRLPARTQTKLASLPRLPRRRRFLFHKFPIFLGRQNRRGYFLENPCSRFWLQLSHHLGQPGVFLRR